jgi:MoxR-like ATPase
LATQNPIESEGTYKLPEAQNAINFQEKENETNIILQYEDKKHDNAKITANFENDEIKRVTLEYNCSNSSNLPLLILLAVVTVL